MLKLTDLLASHGEPEKAAVELRRFLVRHPDDAAIREKLKQILDSQPKSGPRAKSAE